MKKIAEFIGWLTLIYLGLYLMDGVVVQTGLDHKLDDVICMVFKKTKTDTQNETNETEFGFH